MRVASHKTLMCNKLCNCLFSDVLAKRPALDACCTLDGTSTLAGIGASRVWTLGLLLTLFCSGRAGGVQSLDAFKFVESTWYGSWEGTGQVKSNIRPGLRILRASSEILTVFIKDSSDSLRLSPSQAFFNIPIPCSAEIAPLCSFTIP